MNLNQSTQSVHARPKQPSRMSTVIAARFGLLMLKLGRARPDNSDELASTALLGWTSEERLTAGHGG